MIKSDLRQFRFSATEAAEAFADYVKKKSGEQLGVVAGVNINLDTEKNLIIFTIMRMQSPEGLPPGVIPFPGGIHGGSVN